MTLVADDHVDGYDRVGMGMRTVRIQGGWVTQFGRQADRSARELVEEAVSEALRRAEVGVGDIQAVYVGNSLGGLMTGQEAVRAQVVLRQTGLMGLPMVNVENLCASSSTALHLGWQAVAAGLYDRVAVVGYEKLFGQDQEPGKAYRALAAGMDIGEMAEMHLPERGGPTNPFITLFGAVSNGDGSQRFETRSLAMVALKNREHAALNPLGLHRSAPTLEDILASRQVSGGLTRMMCASLCDGAACIILSGSRGAGVRITASVLMSGRGDDLSRQGSGVAAPLRAYDTAGVGPEDLDVVEVLDSTATAELLAYSKLGLCQRGEEERLLSSGATRLGGRRPVNPSGGLLGRGHPIGATGVAQVVELADQLRGSCGLRQVPGARVGLAQIEAGWVGSDGAAHTIHILQS
jgi:acetyl-CoA acetyltransferase